MNCWTNFLLDYKATFSEEGGLIWRLFTSRLCRFLIVSRMYGTVKNRVLRMILFVIYAHYRNSYGLEVVLGSNVDGGLVLAHPYCITLDSHVRIGKQCTLFKGSTIGSIRGGKMAGAPQLVNRVVVCANAMVCGNIKVGDDVLIAANAFVNFDVPSNSVVIGNPGVIHRKLNPSKWYV